MQERNANLHDPNPREGEDYDRKQRPVHAGALLRRFVHAGRGTYVKIKSLGGVNMWKLNKLWQTRSRLYRSKQASKQGRAVPLEEKRKETQVSARN